LGQKDESELEKIEIAYVHGRQCRWEMADTAVVRLPALPV
jgi:hypothetical protein